MKNTKTFAEDLYFFANYYNEKIVLKILDYAKEISEDDTLVELLHEAHVRAAEDDESFKNKFVQDVDDILTLGGSTTRWFRREDEINHTRHSCLTEAAAFRAVCKHLVWQIIGMYDKED